MTGLQVGLYHKTRGGRNTFGAISSDAMVRVTKGVGKRLQLRVTFTPHQQLVMQAHSGLPPTTIPFRWQNFVVTLEETCLSTGEILADKPCELDMMELLTVLPRSGDSGEEDLDDIATEPAQEPFHVGADLVAQCELKLFHLSKTLRFRVEYNTGVQILTGYSLTFFTHDSGKSKKIAFNANNPNEASHGGSATAPSAATGTIAARAPATGTTARANVPKRENNVSATTSHHRAPHHPPAANTTSAATNNSVANVPATNTNVAVSDWGHGSSAYSASAYARPDQSMDHSTMGSMPHLSHVKLDPSYELQHHHMTATQNGFADVPAAAPYYSQLSSSPSESEESTLSAMAAHQQQQQQQVGGQYHHYYPTHLQPYESTSGVTSPSSSQHKSPRSSKSSRYSPTGTHEASEDSTNFEASSSSSGSGLLTPSDSSTLMDADTFSREFNSDHESHISGMPSFLGSLDSSPYDAHSFSSGASFPRPLSAHGSASSSLSSDDGTMHMHAQLGGSSSGHRRNAAASRSPRPKALRRSADSNNASSSAAKSRSNSTRGFAFDKIADEEVDRQLNGQARSKKRKTSESSIVSSSPSMSASSSDFPAVVDSSLDVRGIVRAQAFVHFSDIRFKTNVEDITDALNIVSQLRGKKYEWKDNINGAPAAAGLTGGRKVIGLIAQEVKRVLPEVVVADENGFLSLNYTDMVPVLIEALKQHVENSKLEKTEIKDSISELRAMVDELSQRSGDTLTDTSSYVDFSDDDDLDGSFQDEDLELSDSHGSYSRSAGSFRRRNSSMSSTSSIGGNEGDLSASSASLPDDVPLGPFIDSPHLHRGPTSKSPVYNANAPILNAATPQPIAEKQSTPRKSGSSLSRKTSSNASLAPRPNVTLFACMTHKRLASMGSQQQASGQVAPFTVVSTPSAPGTGHMRSRSASSAFSRATSPNSAVTSPTATANSNAANTGLSTSPGSSSTLASSGNAHPNSANLRDSGSREKDKESGPGSNKRSTTQRISRSFTSFLHHIQASTSNIMNSAANSFSKNGSSSSSNNGGGHNSHSSDESGVSDSESTSTNAHNATGPSLSSSSSSISSTGSSAAVGTGSPPSSSHMAQNQQQMGPQVQSLAQQMTALSLSSSASEVRAQVLTPGFARFSATATPPKLGRPVNRAVVITVSAWHMWSNSDAEKIFLDVSDARHSLIMTGKAVSQIESFFPECTFIHTASIDMRGTVQQTVEDALTDLQRRQVPSCDASAQNNGSKDGNTAASCNNNASSATASLQTQLEQADLVWFIGHSQGIQVCVHLCERLLRAGVLSSSEQMLNILSLGGLHQTCAYNLMSLHGNPAIFAGLHNFGNSRRNFREYRQAVARLLENGVPVTTIAAHQDSMVNVTSSSLEYVRHPNILRALLVHHEFREKFDPKHAFKKASNFTQELTRFALEMRNKNRVIDMLPFVNTTNDASADVQETTSWISHAKTFPRDKLHHLLYNPHIEFPATVPGFYYALGATMSMFNTRAFRFHKATRQLREGVQRHREIPYAPDAYRVSLEWMITRVAQSASIVPTAIVDAPIASATASNGSSRSSKRSKGSTNSSPTSSSSSSSKREKPTVVVVAPAQAVAPTHPPLHGIVAAFKEASNGFSYDFAEQVQLIAAQCSKAEIARLQSAFRYWRPEGPKEMLMQKMVMKSLGWSVAETPALAQYVDGLSEIVNNEKERESPSQNASQAQMVSSSPPSPAAPIAIPSATGHTSPRGHKKDNSSNDFAD